MFKAILSPFIGGLDEKAPVVAPVVQVAAPGAQTVTAPPDQKTAEMRTLLNQTLQARQTPYTALLASAEKLKGVIADPTVRLKAAFVSGGANVEALSNAMLIHIQDLTGSKRQFQAAADEQVAQLEIQQRKSADLQDLAKRNRETAQRLIDEATKAEQDFTTMNSEIVQKQSEIAANLQLFDTTLAKVKGELEAERASLTSLLS